MSSPDKTFLKCFVRALAFHQLQVCFRQLSKDGILDLKHINAYFAEDKSFVKRTACILDLFRLFSLLWMWR